MLAYTAIAILTILATLALLAATKVPAVVTLLAATLVSGAVMLYARLDAGHGDPFELIAFVFCWFFAAIVSLAFVGLGRWLKWPFFIVRKTAEAEGAL